MSIFFVGEMGEGEDQSPRATYIKLTIDKANSKFILLKKHVKLYQLEHSRQEQHGGKSTTWLHFY